MAVTAKDVAKYVGVSPATVSMVFHGKEGVSLAVREKVLNAAQELGYNMKAFHVREYNKSIQIIIFKRHGKVVGDTPFFEQLMRGVIESAQELGYNLTITYFYNNESAAEQLKSIASAKSAGIILLATEMRATDISMFENLNLPMVFLDNWFPNKKYDAVIIDNQRGAWLATHHLISCGHTRIGYLKSNVEIRNFGERMDGYLSAIRSLKGSTNDSEQRIIKVGTSIETAYADMLEYLVNDPVLPTAFFADNDIIAVGCTKAFLKAGYLVPDEISVIGFDDMPVCQIFEPTLTTMAVPKSIMGALTVERLDKIIKNETGGEVIRISVLPEITVRNSVRNLNHNNIEKLDRKK